MAPRNKKKNSDKSDSNNNEAENKAALQVVETEEVDTSDISEEGEPEEEDSETDTSKKKKKVKRTLTSTEVAECYGKGGVARIKSFAAQNDRKVTQGPIEATLNSMRLFITDKDEFDKKFGELDTFLAELKAQGNGKGKKATYEVDGKPYSFKVQRPKSQKTSKKGNPFVVVPLKCLKLKSGQDEIWISFTEEGIQINAKKGK